MCLSGLESYLDPLACCGIGKPHQPHLMDVASGREESDCQTSSRVLRMAMISNTHHSGTA